ncbi:MAG: glutathione S-transferase N-terminal domain-containing protein [Candidatus Puniceispirillales bacterium WSBS_2018_MAG_OTU23]
MAAMVLEHPILPPILWSFRRCPYAMRARLAIKSSGTAVRLREIVLREKPAAFLKASEKGSVPVVVLADGMVIDESLDIMIWALERGDPEDWLYIRKTEPEFCTGFIAELDGVFKTNLDRYKYSSRIIKNTDDIAENANMHRDLGIEFITRLDDRLRDKGFLSGGQNGFLDYATLPFIRQFRGVDEYWFDAQDWPYLHPWLAAFLASPQFCAIMQKYPQYKDDADEVIF